MIIQFTDLLNHEELERIREFLLSQEWQDGKLTAGQHVEKVKNNLQLPLNEETSKLSNRIATILQANPFFYSTTFPRRITPPRFNRYDEGQFYGDHYDNTLSPANGTRIRTDISATLFLSDDYEGGELVIKDGSGSHVIKAKAGTLVVYPSGNLHEVRPVIKGTRLAAIFWIESMVQNKEQRELLIKLDFAIQNLTKDNPNHPSLLQFLGTYQNLLRMWSNP